jgi:hypothetical protein
MEIEAFREELKPIRRWNCAQLIKRKQRSLVCRVFSIWKKRAIGAARDRSNEDEARTREREETMRQSLLSRQNESKQSASQLERLNADLRRELAALQAEQRDIESSTGQIREELKGLSASSVYGLGSSVFSRSHSTRH